MGTIWSFVSNQIERIQDRAVERSPIMYARAEDYTAAGIPRSRIKYLWRLGIRSKITLDTKTRKFLYPVIQNRIERYHGSLQYSHPNLKELLEEFPDWDEERIYSLHDLFELFEVDGDGLIDIPEICVGFDNLGDETGVDERLNELREVDVDGTGAVDFHEFLRLIYNLEKKAEQGESELDKSFKKAEADIKFIRNMSVIQQISAGLL